MLASVSGCLLRCASSVKKQARLPFLVDTAEIWRTEFCSFLLWGWWEGTVWWAANDLWLSPPALPGGPTGPWSLLRIQSGLSQRVSQTRRPEAGPGTGSDQDWREQNQKDLWLPHPRRIHHQSLILKLFSLGHSLCYQGLCISCLNCCLGMTKNWLLKTFSLCALVKKVCCALCHCKLSGVVEMHKLLLNMSGHY